MATLMEFLGQNLNVTFSASFGREKTIDNKNDIHGNGSLTSQKFKVLKSEYANTGETKVSIYGFMTHG